MARRGLLNDAERTRLFEVPGDDTSLIRLYSLSDADRDFVLSKRGARNQLGMAVQIGLLRYPGFGLRLETGPSAALIQFLAQQIDAPWPVFRDYARRDTTRREHFAEAAKHLGLRPCTSADRQDLLDCATNEAMSTDSGSVIVLALLQQLRDRRIILPAPARIERIATGGRARSRRLAADAMVADIDAAVGGRLGLRISKSAPRKPSNVRISTQNILTFDGFFSSLELRAWPCRASVRKPFSLRRGVWPSSGTSSSPPIAIRRIYKKVRASNSQVKWLQQAILSN